MTNTSTKTLSEPKIIIFDFDGVILESVEIKTEAFREIFLDYPEHLDEIVDYHRRNGGISRYVKLRYIYEHILKKTLSESDSQLLANKFSQLVYQKILTCPFVDGAFDFLVDFYQQTPFYICSGTPENELQDIIQKRGLAKFFVQSFGAPTSKPKILSKILHAENILPSQALFVGDATTDLDAAHEVGVEFAGRNNTESFDGLADHVIDDLHGLRKLVTCVE